ncbi:polysaccharide pyruvyl transferase family protein [Mycolicibacterium bacteremicum]|uniref:polysaccharide pyruvyl transferase family protein n=1 Tax=Mycolicibacterium bacteremicum TaxID=564198 RepID=UPI0026F32EBE|nr:polysaccharide pyruvyl transferase family protein [Mycolicibacterium bacteremicum]
MTESMNVVLFNAWHDDNKGDAAITDGTLRILRHAFEHHGVDATFTIVGLNETGPLSQTATRHVRTSWPDVDTLPSRLPTELRAKEVTRPLLDVPIWLARLGPAVVASLCGRTPRGLRALIDAADVVVMVGGSNLHDSASVHPMVSAARLYTLIAPIPAAVEAGRPVLMLGHTLGPFPVARRLSQRMARRMIGIADLAVVREAESIPVAEHLGVDRIELAPDMAFALQPDPTRRVRAVAAALPVPAAKTAVIAVRRHPSLGVIADHRMIGELATAVGRLFSEGRCAGALVVAHTMGPTEIEDDRGPSQELADRLRRRYPDLPVTYLQDDLSPSELAWLYGQSACMIAVRLHAAILAMLSGTPTYAIAYFTHKTTGVMAAVGLADCVGDFATVRAADVVAALAPRIGSESKRRELAAVCAANRLQLERRCTDWLSEFVVGSGVADRSPA